ncbi:MAG: bile acid:sodium symporter family protein [Bacteroidota bacterium]|nr:bile acid:sodium symporter family protein [Bacteroidota bacterium]
MHETFNELLLELDGVKLNFNQESLLALNISIAFIMFGIALGIKRKNFSGIMKNPKSILTGIVAQFLLLPGLTFLIIYFANLPVSVSLGMLLVASCPGGNVSNFITSLSKGNVALSVSLTAISDLLSMLMTPLNFTFWGNLYIGSLPLANPIVIPFLDVMETILILMGIPLTIGILFAQKFPKTTDKIFNPIKTLSIFIFIGFVVFAIKANADYFFNYWYILLPIVLLHNLLALLMGNLSSRLMKLPKKDLKTITIETGIQNSGLALVLIFNQQILPDGMGGVAAIAAMWGIWHIVSGLGLGFFWSNRYARVYSGIRSKL